MGRLSSQEFPIERHPGIEHSCLCVTTEDVCRTCLHHHWICFCNSYQVVASLKIQKILVQLNFPDMPQVYYRIQTEPILPKLDLLRYLKRINSIYKIWKYF